jgi:cysteine-rich repeat protein
MNRTVNARTLLVSSAALATCLASCAIYDAELYQNAEKAKATGGAVGLGGNGGTAGEASGGTAGDAGSAGTGSGGDSGSGGTGGAPPAEWDKVVDWCPLDVTKLLTSAQREHSGVISLNKLANDVTDIGKLTGVDGPDGVIGFTLGAGKRISVKTDFAVAPGEETPPVDLALFLMSACDKDSFIRRNDRCPAGKGEDIWWQMNDALGTYHLGIDSRKYDQSLYDPRVKITVTFPNYGDGTKDWGEACDDGNPKDGDGCTHDGLYELKWQPTAQQEKEPNNHPWGSNVVIMNPGQTMLISGDIGGGACDNDFFALDVPAGAYPRVTVLDNNGQDCAPGAPPTLEFNKLVGANNLEQTKIGDGKPVGTNGCPSFDEKSFPLSPTLEGRYVLEMKGKPGPAAFLYKLKIEMLPPP